MYRWLSLSRETESKMVYYHRNISPLTELPHSSLGQEAISVGCVYPLRKDDQIIPSLRTRGAFLVKGVSSRTLMAGAFGKATAASHGKQSSHHMGDSDCGILVASGVVAGHVPVAVGAAMVARLQKKDYVTMVFYGDGAANRGDVHEALNLAAIKDLPCIFVVEHNQQALSTPSSYHSKVQNFAIRAAGYGMPGVTVDGNDVLAVYEAAVAAIDRARKGEGPTMIECKTYRWRGHSERDRKDLRDPEEIKDWIENKDPLPRFAKFLIDNGYATQEILDDIHSSTAEEVDDAIKFAEQSPYPEPEITLTNVYAEMSK
jgi:pyruvate dehydrogenase E1 component alpha subunit